MLERHRESLAEQLGRDPTRPEFAKSLNLTAPMLEKRLRTGKESKERMILSNMRLVYSIAKKYSGRGVALDDLVTVSKCLGHCLDKWLMDLYQLGH